MPKVDRLSIARPAVVGALLGALSVLISGCGDAPTLAEGSVSYLFSLNSTNHTLTTFKIQDTGGVTYVRDQDLGVTPRGAVAQSAGKMLYVAYDPVAPATGSGIIAYSIDPATGMLTEKNRVSATSSARSLAANPAGTYLFTPNMTAGTLSLFKVAADGSVAFPGTATSAPSYGAGQGPTFASIAANGKDVYVTDFSGGLVTVFEFNETAYTLAPLNTVSLPPNSGQGAFAVAADPTSQFVFVLDRSNAKLHAYHVAGGGTLTLVNSLSTGTDPLSVTMHPGGKDLYVANQGSNSIANYHVDSTTGAISAGAVASTQGTSPQGVWFESTGNYAYVAEYGSDLVEVFRRVAETGGLLSVGTSVSSSGPAFALPVTF